MSTDWLPDALSFAPWLGGAPALIVAALALLTLALAAWLGLRGWLWRGIAMGLVALALAGPQLERADRAALSDIAIVIEDRTASQSLPGRPERIAAARDRLEAQIVARPNLDLRRVSVTDDPDGSLIGAAMAQAIAAVPENRLAGVVVISDGLAHDRAALPSAAPAPVHLLTTGGAEDWDRRLVIDDAPGFGLIGEPVSIRLHVEDEGAVPPAIANRPAQLRVSLNGEVIRSLALLPDIELTLPVTLNEAGENTLVLDITPDEGAAPEGAAPQLTPLNDRVALRPTALRDRLRVLLVSGQPNPGARTWRNLLKSDASVDLIHFTILRPPEKSDGVPVDEMSLIAFPTRELFEDRLQDFDLIVFDRYHVRGILDPRYFQRIGDYVAQGGAVLVVGGPEMATIESLSYSPLGAILPARPTGQVIEAPFWPRLSDLGRRHPVTAGLEGAAPEGPVGGADPARPGWGRWLRQVVMTPQPGAQVLMNGAEGAPLLILAHEGEGRLAMLASDQIWLWGRGFEGGGPQLELLRRIAHWSMDEPELEEEALRVQTGPADEGLSLRIERRSLDDQADPVILTGPDDLRVELPLRAQGPGLFVGEWTAPAPGLYRAESGDLSRVFALGPSAPQEFRRVVADPAPLLPLVTATGGVVLALDQGLPDLRMVAPGRSAHGRGVNGPWIALNSRNASAVTGLSRVPLLPGWGWLILIAGALLAGWLREGRRGAATARPSDLPR